MSGAPPTWHVQVVDETGSTNADLLAAAAAGAPDRTVLRARHQTAGRGRLDRRWDAPAGANLLVSILFRSGLDRPHRLTRRVAVAAARAVERLCPLVVELKWPNDLLTGGAKLAGILAQGAPGAVVVGLGLNVGWAPEGGARMGDGIDPGDVLAAVLDELDRMDDDGEEYRRRLATLGRRVRVQRVGAGDLVGEAIGILDDGRLLVRADDGEHLVDAGDVIHLRAMAD